MGLVSQSGALQIAVGSSGLPAPFGLDQRSHDVALLPDQVFDPINLDLGARPFTEQHAVASFDVNRGCACPPSLYPPGITATKPASAFSVPVSGVIPPAAFSSTSMRLTTTRS
jgi:hypothetical protein